MFKNYFSLVSNLVSKKKTMEFSNVLKNLIEDVQILHINYQLIKEILENNNLSDLFNRILLLSIRYRLIEHYGGDHEFHMYSHSISVSETYFSKSKDSYYRHGPYKAWYINGNLAINLYNKNGKCNGKHVSWALNGNIVHIVEVVDDVYEGKAIFYFTPPREDQFHKILNCKMSRLKCEVNFVNGLKHGTEELYIVKKIEDFSEGDASLIDNSEILLRRYNYVNNLQHGKQYEYGIDGKLTVEEYDNGVQIHTEYGNDHN